MFSECDFLKFEGEASTSKDFDKLLKLGNVVFSDDNLSDEEKKDIYMKISLMYEIYSLS